MDAATRTHPTVDALNCNIVFLTLYPLAIIAFLVASVTNKADMAGGHNNKDSKNNIIDIDDLPPLTYSYVYCMQKKLFEGTVLIQVVYNILYCLGGSKGV